MEPISSNREIKSRFPGFTLVNCCHHFWRQILAFCRAVMESEILTTDTDETLTQAAHHNLDSPVCHQQIKMTFIIKMAGMQNQQFYSVF